MKPSLMPVAAALDPKRWYDQRRSGTRAGMWQTQRPIEPQSRVETLKTHRHGHRGDADGSAGIRTAVDLLGPIIPPWFGSKAQAVTEVIEESPAS